jgi:hypothetical protein
MLLFFAGVARWLVRSWIWWSFLAKDWIAFACYPEGLFALL